MQKPVGTGPYKLVEYQLNSRIVLERNDAYWGPKPKIRRVIFEIIKDPSARVAAIQSGQVDLTINVPVREVDRLGHEAGLAAELNPITRVILLQCRNDLGFADDNVRLAAHHAIDKQALSKAFYGGVAVPLSMPATPGTPGYVADFKFSYDPALAVQLAGEIRLQHEQAGADQVRHHQRQRSRATSTSRARSSRCGRKSGSTPRSRPSSTQNISSSTAGPSLPEATLYSWDNATGDPEMFGGYLLNPEVAVLRLEGGGGRREGGRAIQRTGLREADRRLPGGRSASRSREGATIPLLQSVQSLARKKSLSYVKYGNGWVLASSMDWT